MKAIAEITVRWADCDPMGHVNNAKYFTYMEQARVVLFRTMFNISPTEPIKPENFPFILAEISCRFLKPTTVDETLIVTATVSEIKNASFIIEYVMKDKPSGENVATGRSAQVWYDYRTGKSKPIPDQFRKILESQ